jgi:hypothetical protein
VRFVQEGWHCWPDAPEKRAYLREKHRHLFHIEASCEVTHDDREVEFHDLRDEVEIHFGLLAGAERDFGAQSCEQIALRLAEHLCERFRGREFFVSVSEDGEAGARVWVGRYPPS